MSKILAWLDAHSTIDKKVAVAAAPAAIAPDLPWIAVARKELGTKEADGDADNPAVIKYMKDTDLGPSDWHDSVAWCACFVSWCLDTAGIKSAHDAWARSYLNWGIKLAKPCYGCIAIYDRGNGNGHVNFYLGRDDDGDLGLGGNQSNAVNKAYHLPAKCLGYRWPKDFPLPAGAIVSSDAA